MSVWIEYRQDGSTFCRTCQTGNVKVTEHYCREA